MKEELLKRSAQHRERLEKEVELISERTQSVLTNALIIGGTLAAGYLVARLFTRSSRKPKVKASKVSIMPAPSTNGREYHEEEPSSPGIMSQIGTALASQATIFLLSLAKEKLADYMASPAEKKVEEEK